MKVRIAITQELRAQTAHFCNATTADAYNKMINYQRKYGALPDILKMRAMVTKLPIGDKSHTEHLHALRLEFGTKPDTVSILRHF